MHIGRNFLQRSFFFKVNDSTGKEEAGKNAAEECHNTAASFGRTFVNIFSTSILSYRDTFVNPCRVQATFANRRIVDSELIHIRSETQRARKEKDEQGRHSRGKYYHDATRLKMMFYNSF